MYSEETKTTNSGLATAIATGTRSLEQTPPSEAQLADLPTAKIVNDPKPLLNYVTSCARGAIIGKSKLNGNIIIIPACCKRWSCSHCAPRLAKLWAARVAASKPERFITLTVNPAWFQFPSVAYAKLKEEWYKLVTKWRAMKHKIEYVAVWEIQPSTGMPHLHILQKGDYIPQKWIKKWMEVAHVGSVEDIRKITNPEGAAAYIVKYTAKSTIETKTLIGRNRLIMVSRGMFTGIEPKETDYHPEDWEWTWLQTEAYKCILKLMLTWHYKLVTDAFPRHFEIAATDIDVNLEQIAFALDPTWETREGFPPVDD